MTKTTTSVRIDLDLYMKVKTREINLSNLINNFLGDYLIDDFEEFELKELRKQKEEITKEIELLKVKEINYLASINKKEEELRKHVKEVEEKNYQKVKSMQMINPMRYD